MVFLPALALHLIAISRYPSCSKLTGNGVVALSQQRGIRERQIQKMAPSGIFVLLSTALS
jgi:hypothetical protein